MTENVEKLKREARNYGTFFRETSEGVAAEGSKSESSSGSSRGELLSV